MSQLLVSSTRVPCWLSSSVAHLVHQVPVPHPKTDTDIGPSSVAQAEDVNVEEYVQVSGTDVLDYVQVSGDDVDNYVDVRGDDDEDDGDEDDW